MILKLKIKFNKDQLIIKEYLKIQKFEINNKND